MDLSQIMKLLGPMIEPMLEQMIDQYWPQLDEAISGLAQEDAKMLFMAMSPAMKQFVILELKKQLK